MKGRKIQIPSKNIWENVKRWYLSQAGRMSWFLLIAFLFGKKQQMINEAKKKKKKNGGGVIEKLLESPRGMKEA